jgi:hypothetical protein
LRCILQARLPARPQHDPRVIVCAMMVFGEDLQLYGVVYDSRSQKEYHNASHTVTVDKVSKKIAAVAIP